MKFGKTSARKQMTLNDIAADRQQWKNQHQRLAEISWTMNTWPDLTYVSHNSCSWPTDVSIPTDTFITSVAKVPNNHDWIIHMLLCKCTDVQISGDTLVIKCNKLADEQLTKGSSICVHWHKNLQPLIAQDPWSC